MRLTKERISSISKSILESLLQKDQVVLQGSKDALAQKIEHTIREDLMVEDRLEEEVKGIMKNYQAEIDQGNVDYRKMFLMIKKKLVKERELIL